MGCFSYICPECDKAIHSHTYDTCVGQEVRLAHLEDGKVVEQMFGRYTSYGHVHIPTFTEKFKSGHTFFIDGKEHTVHNENKEHNWILNSWRNMVEKQYDSNAGNGIVAIHEECWRGSYPIHVSKSDPNQGWVDDD